MTHISSHTFVDSPVGSGRKSVFGEFQLYAVHAEELLVLLYYGILGFGENPNQSVFIQGLQCHGHGQTANHFRNEAVFQEVLRSRVP